MKFDTVFARLIVTALRQAAEIKNYFFFNSTNYSIHYSVVTTKCIIMNAQNIFSSLQFLKGLLNTGLYIITAIAFTLHFL